MAHLGTGKCDKWQRTDEVDLEKRRRPVTGRVAISNYLMPFTRTAEVATFFYIPCFFIPIEAQHWLVNYKNMFSNDKVTFTA